MSTPDNGPLLAIAEPLIKGEEACRLTAYQDTRNIWTIAWGRADIGVVPGMTCTQAQADQWFDAKVKALVGALDRLLPWWRSMDLPRQAVLLSMAYQMGVGGVSRFPKALEAMERGCFATAASQMLASEWAKQTPNRARRAAEIMRTGELP